MPIFQDAHTQRCAALQLAVQQQLLAEDNPAVMLMDLDMISRTIHHMQHEAGYPPNTLHTVAVKANPVGKLLQHFRDRGFGAEVGHTRAAAAGGS
jgi:diaminopimelate decarboxylase